MAKPAEGAWGSLLYDVQQGKHRTPKRLAELIEECGVPRGEAAEYVARRMRGDIRLRDGTSPNGGKDRSWIAFDLADEVAKFEAAFRMQGEPTARGKAVALVATFSGIKPDTLKRRLARDLSEADRDLVRNPELAEYVVRHYVEKGYARLDAVQGLVFLPEGGAPGKSVSAHREPPPHPAVTHPPDLHRIPPLAVCTSLAYHGEWRSGRRSSNERGPVQGAHSQYS